MKTLFFRLLAMCAVLLAGFAPVALPAQDLGTVKARITQRLPKLDELKAKGAVGENNRGLVEVRGTDAEAGAVVSAENSDRDVVYAAIAKKTGASAEQVARSRAKRIAENTAAGVWLQREDGTWYKK